MTTADETIQPAMSAEQWAAELARTRDDGTLILSCNWYAEIFSGGTDQGIDNHHIAAVALYGAPFGFTQEDVALLRGAAESVDGEWGVGRMDDPMALRLNALADRIAALLPPK